VTRLLIVPASIMSTLFPAFSTLSGRGEWEHVERLVARAVKFVLFALGPVVLVLVAGAHDILNLWLGPEFARHGSVALQVLSVGILINALAHVPYSMIQGLGRPDVTAKFHLIELPLQAVLVWFLVRNWGIPGAAFAWSIRVALDAALLFYAASRLSSVSLTSYLAERVPQTAALLFAFGMIATIGAAALPLLWHRALLIATLVTAGALVGWLYSLGDGDRGHVLGAFRSAAAR
jgi:O-antigen/teichoic acid export membrane protein